MALNRTQKVFFFFFFFFLGGGGEGGIFEEYARMLHIIFLRARFSQNVKYWYEIRVVLVPIFTCCEESVPIFHGMKFAKYEICGSTMRLICEELVRFFSDVKNWYSILTTVKNRVQFLAHVKNWCSIFTNVKNRYKILTHVKNG